MKKLLVTLSLLGSSLLMAHISPEYSSNVEGLKAQYSQTVAQEKPSNTKKDTSSFTSSISNIFGTSKPKEEKKPAPVYSRDVKITKVLNFSDITSYSKSHKILAKTSTQGSVKKSHIIAKAEKVSATKVLLYVSKDIRYIYYFAN